MIHKQCDRKSNFTEQLYELRSPKYYILTKYYCYEFAVNLHIHICSNSYNYFLGPCAINITVLLLHTYASMLEAVDLLDCLIM